MSFKNILLFFLAFSLLIETTIFSFPLVVIFSLFLFILSPFAESREHKLVDEFEEISASEGFRSRRNWGRRNLGRMPVGASFPSIGVLVSIFIVGLLLDSVKAGIFGTTSLFLFVSFLVLTIYQKVFNFKDSLTVLFFIFLTTVAYAYIFTYSINIFSYVLFFALLFASIRYFKNVFSQS